MCSCCHHHKRDATLNSENIWITSRPAACASQQSIWNLRGYLSCGPAGAKAHLELWIVAHVRGESSLQGCSLLSSRQGRPPLLCPLPSLPDQLRLLFFPEFSLLTKPLMLVVQRPAGVTASGYRDIYKDSSYNVQESRMVNC